MTTAREIMHVGAECVGENDTLAYAAQRMRQLDIGAMPICGEDDRIRGILTDRDIVVSCVAEGGDPHTVTAGELARGTPIWVDVDAEEEEVVELLGDNQVRRLPVMENSRLVGMISEVDIASHLSEDQVAAFAKKVYAAPV